MARLRPNCSVDAESLGNVLRSFMELECSRDLRGLMQHAERTVTWKTSPQACVLVKYASIAAGVLEICPSLCVGQVKMFSAIIAENTRDTCLFPRADGISPAVSARFMAATMRCVFSKYRELKHDYKLSCVLSKASISTIRLCVLAAIQPLGS